MRWPRWFRSGGGDAPAPEQAGAAPAAPVQRAPAPAARRDWAGLPALQPVSIADGPPSTDHQRFVHDLGGHQLPYRALAPLSHDVSTDAPRGIASGIGNAQRAPLPAAELSLAPPAAPVAEVLEQPGLPPAAEPSPVQRAPLAGATSPLPAAPSRPTSTAALPPARPATPPLPVRRAIAHVAAPGAGAIDVAPTRTTAVQRAATPSAAGAGLARLALPAGDRGSGHAAHDLGPVADVAAERPGHAPAPPAPSGDAGPGSSATVVQRAPLAGQTPTASSPSTAGAVAPAEVQRRRPLLGEPLRRVPWPDASKPAADPSVQRAAEPAPSPLAGPPSASAPTPAAPVAGDLAARPVPPAPPGSAAGGADLPLAPPAPSDRPAERSSDVVQRAPAPGPGLAVSEAARPPVPARPVGGSAGRAPSLPQAPLVSQRPIASSASPQVQRAPAPVPAEVRTMVETGTGADLGGVSVHRGPEVADTAAQLSARAYTTGGEVHLPEEHGPLSSGTGRSLLAHELTHVAQQRTLGSSLPPESSPAGARLEAEAQANEHAALHGGAQRSPLPQPLGQDGQRSWSAHAPGPTPQRAPVPGAEHGPRPDPARAAVAAGVGALGSDGAVHFRPPGAVAGAATVPASRPGVQRAIGKVPASTPPLTLARPGPRPVESPAAPASSPAEAEGMTPDVGPVGPDAPASVSFPELTTPANGGQAVPGPAAPPATAAGASAASADDEGGGDDLDALVRRLWPRLHQRIRTDLLIARERSGHLVDRR